MYRLNNENRLRVEIEDTGPGMTPEQAAQLFRPFTQADASVTREYGGTGLGLTISRRLSQLLGGEVRLDFSELGKGSQFSVELPLQETPDSKLVHELNAFIPEFNEILRDTVHFLPGRILLAEDGEENRQLISYHLKKAGADLEIAENGQIALEMIEAAAAQGRPFDLLLTDMQMPEMDGYTLAKTLRSRGYRIPTVAITAHAMADDREKCLNAGCHDCLTKPIAKNTLISTCWKWMEIAKDPSIPLHSTTVLPEITVTMKSDVVRVLRSELADDQEFAPLINKFLQNLKTKVKQMSECLITKRLDDLASLAHQLKGAGGGYGFPTITDAAKLVEQRAKTEVDIEQIATAVSELTSLCQRAIASGNQSDASDTSTKPQVSALGEEYSR